MSLPSSSSPSTGEDVANLTGKVQTPETVEVVSESSTTTQSNGSLSKDEARTILVSDTPTDSDNAELVASAQEQLEVIPDSNDGMSPSQPAEAEAPLFGRSATSVIQVETTETPETLVTEPKTPTNVAANEPELITLSSSASSVTDSPTVVTLNSSVEESKAGLENSMNPPQPVVEGSTKPKPSAENVAATSPKPSAVDEASEPKSDKATADPEKHGDGDGKSIPDKKTDGKPEDKTDADKAAPLPDVDIEEPIKVKYITPLGESEKSSADAESSTVHKEATEERNEEEKEAEEDQIDEDAEEAHDTSKTKRAGAAARGRSRGRGGRRGRGRSSRGAARGRSPRQRDVEEQGEEEETPEETGDEAGKQKDETAKTSAEKETPNESGEGDEIKEKSASPKKRRTRTGVDTKLVAESKAQGVTPDQPESESRRVLRTRYQSPVGSGSGQEATPRRRRGQRSTSSGDDMHESDGERSVRRKRGATKAMSPDASPSQRQVRSKRARLSSGEQHQRSASSDSDVKEEKRARRTRGTDTPAEMGESSKSTSAKRTPAARVRRSRGGGGAGGASSTRKKTGDPFDFDDTADAAPAGPFRRVNLSKSNFGDMKFTKALEKSSEKNKYTVTAKAAELKKQHTGDTVIISDSPPLYRVTTAKHYVIEKLSPRTNRVLKKLELDKPEGTVLTHTLDPDFKRLISPERSSPSSGNLADVSSMTSSASLGKKQDSAGPKRYLDNPENIIEKDDRRGGARGSQARQRAANRTSSGSTRVAAGSMSLFSDIDMADDFSPSAASARSRSVKRNRGADADDGHTTGDESSSHPAKRRRRTTDQVTPKPKEPEALKLTPEEQLSADFPSQNAHALLPGARVLARWTDKCFYAATVMTDEGLGRYKIAFYDGAVRVKPRPDLVPVSQLKPGDVLMVTKSSESGDADLETVKILKTPATSSSEEWFEGLYEVENEVQECTERVSWEKFVIDVDQTKHYVTTSVNKAAQDITADNITEKKERSTRSRGAAEHSSQEHEEPEVKEEPTLSSKRRSRTPRTPRSPPPSRRSTAPSSAASSSAPSTSPKRRRAAESVGRVSKIGSPTSRRHHQPPQIFAGLRFVLTSANRRTKENDASEEEKPTTITFNKKHVRQLIEDHGGLVVDEFSQVMDLSRCFLIADTHYRTHKYLSALARAVPCVKHTWIHDSCSAKELLDHADYMLAAGYSLEKDKILPWHDKCPDLLSGKSVLVYTENRPNNPGSLDFVQIWAPLVKCMGANVIETSPSAGTEKVDILLTDATCSQAQLQAAEGRGAKAVSSEWLIQAIITGRQPRPEGHKKYEYDYVETAAAAANAGAAAAAAAGGGGTINENPTP